MSWLRPIVIVLTAGLVSGLVSPLQAQTVGDPDKARFRLGRFAFSPVIDLTNVGHDDNVFSESREDGPDADWTGTISPGVEGWFRSPRVRAMGRSKFEFFYYKELSHLRAFDTDNWGRVELALNRLIPYVTGALLNTRHQQSLEIDSLARRRSDEVRVGVDWRITEKASLGAYRQQSHVAYEEDEVFKETDLAQSLNRSGTIDGAIFRYVLTPFTTVAMNVEQGRDRFEFSPDRDTINTLVAPSVEFKPRALISGHAAVGFRSRKYLRGDVPDFRGTFASANLQYTLLLRTQIGFEVRRDLDYSYIDVDYVQAGFTVSVTQRLADNWDIDGSVGRYRLTYHRRALQTLPGEPSQTLPGETYLTAHAGLGYHIGRTRIGFNVQHYQRESDATGGRGFERIRFGSSLRYVF